MDKQEREEIKNTYRVVTSQVRLRAMIVGLLIDTDRLEQQVERLLAGNFTPEEFQDLCHTIPADDVCKFTDGCAGYWKKLFGDKAPSSVTELQNALAESLKLQSHYAQLLNQLDHGARMTFPGPQEWLERLRVVANYNRISAPPTEPSKPELTRVFDGRKLLHWVWQMSNRYPETTYTEIMTTIEAWYELPAPAVAMARFVESYLHNRYGFRASDPLAPPG